MPKFDLGGSNPTPFNPTATYSPTVAPNVNWEGQLMSGLDNIGKAASAVNQNQNAADFLSPNQPQDIEPWLAEEGATPEEKRASFEEYENALSDSRGALSRIREAQRQGAYTSSEAAMFARQQFNEVMSNPMTAIYGDQLANEYKGLLGGGSNSFESLFPKTQEELMAEARQKGVLDAAEAYSEKVFGYQQIFGISAEQAQQRIRTEEDLSAQLERVNSMVEIETGNQALMRRRQDLINTQLYNQGWDHIQMYGNMTDPTEQEQARTGVQNLRRQALQAANASGLSGPELQQSIDNINSRFDNMLSVMDDQRLGTQFARIQQDLMSEFSLQGTLGLMAANEKVDGLLAVLSTAGGPEAGNATVSILRNLVGDGDAQTMFTASGLGVDPNSRITLSNRIDALTELLRGTPAGSQAGTGTASGTPESALTSSVLLDEAISEMVGQIVEMNGISVPQTMVEALSYTNLPPLEIAAYEGWNSVLRNMTFEQAQQALTKTRLDLIGQIGNEYNLSMPVAVRPAGNTQFGRRIGTMTGAPTNIYAPDLFGSQWEIYDPITGEEVRNAPEALVQYLIGTRAVNGGENDTWVASWSLVTGQTPAEVELQAEAVQNNVDLSRFAGNIIRDAQGNLIRIDENGNIRSLTEEEINSPEVRTHTRNSGVRR